MKIDGVSFAGVRAPKEDEIGFFDFLVGGGTSPGSKDCRQTDDAGGMSSSVTRVDIV